MIDILINFFKINKEITFTVLFLFFFFIFIIYNSEKHENLINKVIENEINLETEIKINEQLNNFNISNGVSDGLCGPATRDCPD